MTHPLIQLDNINKSFVTDDIETLALSNIELNIEKGEFVAITGPSGCGKSTLLSLLGLLDVASSGHYQLNQHQTEQLSKGNRARIRNLEIGFIFQSFNLISELNVYENIELPLSYRKDLNKADIKQKVTEVLAQVEMSHRSKHFPSQLSGGQQQRVAIARALVGSPSLLLADEPTGNLDSKNAQMVMDLLSDLHKKGATICMVTHDNHSAAAAPRRISLFDGRIVEDTKPPQIDAA
ncbi:ABC transporter ATP-binding protein [uncultured Paraglaciecola sp.]|uniref:ABC transporter ATP-binding protein n=1 Tax=uncultured Paraglaciecola sp. TaxID=1765024 RepID=UPI00261EA43B|nr:ABC transporter ATP-binding protein [uncultured Paraglaciecola sp.]